MRRWFNPAPSHHFYNGKTAWVFPPFPASGLPLGTLALLRELLAGALETRVDSSLRLARAPRARTPPHPPSHHFYNQNPPSTIRTNEVFL